MKKVILILTAVLVIPFLGKAQHLELKTNPIGAIFGQIPLSVEYVMNDNIGIEATMAYSYQKGDVFDGTSSASGFVVSGLFKYYFGPEDGGDKFYAFPYVRYANRKWTFDDGTTGSDVTATYTAFGVGFGAGYKWVAESGLLFDIGAGIGKNFGGEFTYDDPDYTGSAEPFPINGIFRISIGYRF